MFHAYSLVQRLFYNNFHSKFSIHYQSHKRASCRNCLKITIETYFKHHVSIKLCPRSPFAAGWA